MPFAPKRLNKEQVEEIRFIYSMNFYTQKQIAEKFKISQPLVSKIINDKVHVPNFKFCGNAEIKLGYKYGN